MQLSCSICRDKILVIHDVIITSNCGHLYHRTCFEPWIKANPTCPTCRSKQKTNAIKVFFTTEENISDSPDVVIDRLETRCEELGGKNREIETELSTIKAENSSFTERIASFEKEVHLKTAKISHLKATLHSLKNETKRLNEENSILQRSCKETTKLEGVKTMLEGTHDEVTEMLKNTSCDYNSVETLCTFVVQLKQCNLKFKEKVKELTKSKKELSTEIKGLNRRIEDLESRLQNCDENSRPKIIESEPIESREPEYIDLDEPFTTSLEKTLGIDKKIKVLDERRIGKTDGSQKRFQRHNLTSNGNKPSSSFQYDGMGGSSRSRVYDLGWTPYERNNSKTKHVIKSKLKCQQPSIKGFFVGKE